MQERNDANLKLKSDRQFWVVLTISLLLPIAILAGLITMDAREAAAGDSESADVEIAQFIDE